jgi:hypothetical protein
MPALKLGSPQATDGGTGDRTISRDPMLYYNNTEKDAPKNDIGGFKEQQKR